MCDRRVYEKTRLLSEGTIPSEVPSGFKEKFFKKEQEIQQAVMKILCLAVFGGCFSVGAVAIAPQGVLHAPVRGACASGRADKRGPGPGGSA